MRKTALNDRPLAPSTDRCLAILELLSAEDGPLTLSEIHRRLGVSKNMVFRILSDLEVRGYAVRDDGRGWGVGRTLLELAAPRVRGRNLVDEAAPEIRALCDRCGESVGLLVPCGAEAVLVYFQPSRQPVRTIFDLGFRVALYSNAPGKVFLAFGDEAERKARWKRQSFRRRTARTVTDPAALERELDLARRRGYTVDRAEDLEGAHCVAAPVFGPEGRVVASLVITAPIERMPESKFAAFGRQAVSAAGAMSSRLQA